MKGEIKVSRIRVRTAPYRDSANQGMAPAPPDIHILTPRPFFSPLPLMNGDYSHALDRLHPPRGPLYSGIRNRCKPTSSKNSSRLRRSANGRRIEENYVGGFTSRPSTASMARRKVYHVLHAMEPHLESQRVCLETVHVSTARPLPLRHESRGAAGN